MRPATTDALCELLRNHCLLRPNQIDDLNKPGGLRYVLTDPARMLSYLTRQGWLTSYQSQLVTEGRTGELVFGPYRLLDPLGEGGNSRVYRAWDTKADVIVALKILTDMNQTNEEMLGRFKREVRIATKLSHPNIVRTLNADMTDTTGFLAMEFVGGIDLRKLVKEQGPCSPDQACDYTRQAAEGLDYAAQNGLVHRDIKPANLLLTAQGFQIKVLDLGLARPAQGLEQNQQTGQSVLTQQNSTLGTADYMAPEQARNPRGVDSRADIYSLGCTLVELLSGQPPYPGGSVLQKLCKHQFEPPPKLASRGVDLPGGLQAVIEKMMAKKPEDRYATPGEVAAALEPFC